MIVDGHAHIWTIDPGVYPWQPTFGIVPTEQAPPEPLISIMDRRDVDWTVLVQPSAYGGDHRFLLEATQRWPDRFVAIGLVDPAEPATVTAAANLVQPGACVGLRVNLSLDLGRALRQASAESWSDLETLGVPICLRITPAHHNLARLILGRHPGLRIVIDHLGLPDAVHLAAAADRLTELAAFDNALLKIAGLARCSGSGPPFRDTWRLIEAAVRSFGASRLLWGSDYPGAEPDLAYKAALDATESALASMPFVSTADRDRVMAGTSLELWGRPMGRPT